MPVFSNLSSAEKDAFFSLLDEYFTSRPELLSSLNNEGSSAASLNQLSNTTAGKAAASAIRNSFVSAQQEPSVSSWRRPNPGASPQPPNADLPSTAGRVAAAAAAFKGFNPGQNPAAAAAGGPPRPPPRRASSNVSSESEYQTPEPAPSSVGRLATSKKFGDVDMSSGKNMFNSLRNSTANKTAVPPSVAPPIPSAFPPKKNTFAPPPSRRGGESAAASRAAPPPAAPPRYQEPVEQEPEGEWVEALYDYTSEDPGDLEVQEGQRILILEKTSDDWWTGEIDGRRGLFPAAYVKAL